MKHNFFAHTILGTILFIVNSYVFKGAGTWSSIGELGARATGTLIGSQAGDFSASATQAESLLPIIIGIIINIVIYYLLAGIIIFIFNMIFRKK